MNRVSTNGLFVALFFPIGIIYGYLYKTFSGIVQTRLIASLPTPRLNCGITT